MKYDANEEDARLNMATLELLKTRIDPISEENRHLIRKELTELLRNPLISNSKRYPALLQYVVEKTLSGRSDELKERTIGIEVFHRAPDYDNNNDTVVRVTAGEVRKRIALIYLEAGEDHPIQIVLASGSYVPEFYRTHTDDRSFSALVAAPAIVLPVDSPSIPVGQKAPVTSDRHIIWRFTAAKLAIFATVFLLIGFGLTVALSHLNLSFRETSVDRFWRPMRASATSVLLCAGASAPSATDARGFTEAEKTDEYQYFSAATAGVLASLTDLYSREHFSWVIQPASFVTLTDMRSRPTVLVGAYNNRWTRLLLDDLRYRFTPKGVSHIYDSTNPQRVWARPHDLPYNEKDDFAVIARFRDKRTDGPIVVIAGLGKNGTEAAAQFVTTARYLDLLDRQSPGWESKNIEIVLKTQVVDSKTSAPSIEAIYTW